MNKELKQAIVNYMFDNVGEFQLVISTFQHFRQYIYTGSGDYCIGGEKVRDFILLVNKLLEF